MSARSTSPWLTTGMVALIAGLVLTAIQVTRPAPPRSRAPEPVPAPVEVMRVAVETRADTATVYGEATPFRIATLAAEATGKVIWRSPVLEVGGVVAEGEALLLLDDGLAKLTRDAAQAGLEAREADRKRQEVALKTATEQEELARREAQRLEKLVKAEAFLLR